MKRNLQDRIHLAIGVGRYAFFTRHLRVMSAEEMRAQREKVAAAFLMARAHAQSHLRAWTQAEREEAFGGFLRLQAKHGELREGWLLRESRRAWRELTAIEACRPSEAI